MVSGWRVVSGAELERWDGWLASFPDGHMRQSRAWARLKAGGWRPLFTGHFEGGVPNALGLCLLRRAPLGAANLCWVNAGPVFRDLTALRAYLEGLKAHLAAVGRPVLRINPDARSSEELRQALGAAGFRPSAGRLDTGLTAVLDLGLSEEALRAKLDRKWRNQLKSAEKRSPVVEFGRGPAFAARFLPLYEALQRRKKVSERLTTASLAAQEEALGGSMTYAVASCEGKDGAAMVLWTFGARAWLSLAAADAHGLERQLPNFLYWRAALALKERGLREWDLAGVDPKGNWGVFNFKRGLAGETVERAGEWDWSPVPGARPLLNAAIAGARRLGRL